MAILQTPAMLWHISHAGTQVNRRTTLAVRLFKVSLMSIRLLALCVLGQPVRVRWPKRIH